MAWSIIPRAIRRRPVGISTIKYSIIRSLVAARHKSNQPEASEKDATWDWQNPTDNPPSVSFTNPRQSGIYIPGKSHVIAPTADPLQEITVGTLAERAANKFSDREAVISVFEDKKITFADLLEQADQLAAGLLSIGLKKGDRVGLWSPNSLNWIICKIAIVRAGLILVTLNPAYQTPELKYALSNVRVRGIICAQSFRTQNYPQMLTTAAPEIASCAPGQIKSAELPDLRVAIVMSDVKIPGFLSLEEAKALSSTPLLHEVQSLQDKLSVKDVCEIQFTSGTTGKPKGCMLTHYSMTNNAIISGGQYVMREHGKVLPQRVLVSLPFFHVYASVIGILSSFYHGNTVVIASELYTAETMVTTLHKIKCHMLMTAPTMLVDLLNSLKTGMPAPEHLRFLTTGGGMTTAELLRGLRKAIPNTFIGQGYGMTETSTAVTALPVESTEEQIENTVGKFLPHVEAKIVDPEGNTLPINTPGELVLKGYMCSPGYWEDPEKTKELIDAQGWLHTGDLFKIREDGYVEILGRIKDMIVRGGENVYPKEIENELEARPDVMEALVFPVSDERLGEEVACVIRLRNKDEMITHDDIKEFLKEKLAYYKIPRYSRIVEDVPRTAAGKAQKFKLREMMEKYIKEKKLKPK